MVPPGNVAVGRTGGTLGPDLGTKTGFFAGHPRGCCATDMPTQSRWDHGPADPAAPVTWSDGSIMRRAFAMAAVATTLAGCSSSMDSFNYFKSTPPTVQVQLESTPPGADARTSIGPGCKTPCSVTVTPGETTSFTVNYSLAGREPASMPVQVTKTSGGAFSADTFKVSPNPVMAELQPVAPPPKAKPMRPKRKKPAAAAAPADAAPAQ
jgi:hypothetical protein